MSKNIKVLISLAGILSILFCTFFIWKYTYLPFSNRSEMTLTKNNQSLKIYLYSDGHKTELSNSSSNFAALKEKSESLFASSNNALYEMVSEKSIADEKNGKAIELVYGKPTILKNVAYKKEIQVDHLLVSESGVIWFGLGKYQSGPVTIGSPGITKLNEILNNH